MNVSKIHIVLISLAFVAGLFACSNEPSGTVPSTPAGRQEPAPAETLAAHQDTADSGRVMETMDVAPYTYLRLDDGAGHEIWAAVPQTRVEIGEMVALEGGAVMTNFTSKSLNRTFASIIFAGGITRLSDTGSAQPTAGAGSVSPGAAPVGMAAQAPAASSTGGSARAIAPFAGQKVEKSTAPNGHTVGELFDRATDLAKQKVTVKGQVVKMSPNIMGRNWIHIQDGTGDPSNNTHDLVVTSADTVEKGAIVTLEGVLAVDKDFGFGYRYDVIVEDAVLVK
jgi:hypothetical protein